MRLTKSQRADLHAMFGGRCAYCGCELGARWHADHFEPCERKLKWVRGKGAVATGEYHKPGNNRLDNFMPACAPCNISKHSMTLEGWRAWIAGHVNSLNQYHPIYRLAKAYGLITETGAPVTFYFEQAAATQQEPRPVPKDAKLWSDGIWRDSSGNELGSSAPPPSAGESK